MVITVEEYHAGGAKRRLADEIMQRFDLDPNKIVQMRLSEGVIEYDWLWWLEVERGEPVVRTTTITAR